MKTYPILIKQTDVHTVAIKADSAAEALDIAMERYVINGEELPDFSYEEPLEIEIDNERTVS